VILDAVSNHSSDKHPWFLKALQGDKKYKHYYMWAKRKRKGNKTPPNNWISKSGGPAWTYVKSLKQWYLHQYGPGLPDLNYSNPDVIKETEVSFREKYNCFIMLLFLSLNYDNKSYQYQYTI